MGSPTRAPPEPLRLSFRDASRPVLVEPPDEDRFFTTVRRAAIACQAAEKQAQFWNQIKRRLLPKLTAWLHNHRDNVKGAYLAVREGGLLLLVVKSNAAYDSDFEDELTDLDLEIAQDPALDLVAVDVTAIPLVSKDVAESYMGSDGVMAEFRG